MGDPHIGFVIAAYGLAGLTIAAMIGWVVLDSRGMNDELARATRALDLAKGGAKGDIR